jgi:serpin B
MRRNVLGTVLYGLLGACSVGNTGNPMSNDGPMSGKPPTGISLLRSELARDKDPAVSDAERTQLGVDQRAFSFALFDALSADNPNLFYSPYSIATALSMVYAGAEGETQTEMAQALSFSLPEPALHAAFNATDLALDGRASEVKPGDGGDGFELSTINANFTSRA